MKVLITLIGDVRNRYMLPVLPGDKVKLVKEPDNCADDEAIAVLCLANQKGMKLESQHTGIEYKDGYKGGYVANSVTTKANGTWSAGRIIDRIDEDATAKIIAVKENCIIAQLELDN